MLFSNLLLQYFLSHLPKSNICIYSKKKMNAGKMASCAFKELELFSQHLCQAAPNHLFSNSRGNRALFWSPKAHFILSISQSLFLYLVLSLSLSHTLTHAHIFITSYINRNIHCRTIYDTVPIYFSVAIWLRAFILSAFLFGKLSCCGE